MGYTWITYGLGLRIKGFPKLGMFFWGPHNKDYGALGAALGSPLLGNYHQPQMTPVKPVLPRSLNVGIGGALS